MTIQCDPPDCTKEVNSEHGLTIHKARAHGISNRRTPTRARKPAAPAPTTVEPDDADEQHPELFETPITFSNDEWNTVECAAFIDGISPREWVERELAICIESISGSKLVGQLRSVRKAAA